MAYSKIERHMWNDDRFRRFPRDVRQMWQYLLTCEHGNMIGVFVLDPLYAMADLSSPDDRWSEQRVADALGALIAADRIDYDPEVRLVLIRQHLKHNQPANPNVAKAALSELAQIPFSKRLWERFLEQSRKHCQMTTARGEPFCQPWVEFLESRLADELEDLVAQQQVKPFRNGYGNGYPNGMPNQEQYQEQEQEQKKTSLSSSERPNIDGSIKEVFEYWQTRCGHERTRLTPDRRGKIKARLRSYSVADLKRAIDGAAESPFHQGDNPQQTRYDFIETIFKNDASTERLMLGTRRASPAGVALDAGVWG